MSCKNNEACCMLNMLKFPVDYYNRKFAAKKILSNDNCVSLYTVLEIYIFLFDKYGERVDCIFFPLLDNYSIRTSMKKNLCKRNSSYRLVVKVEFVEPSCRLRLSTSCNTSRTRRS